MKLAWVYMQWVYDVTVVINGVTLWMRVDIGVCIRVWIRITGTVRYRFVV